MIELSRLRVGQGFDVHRLVEGRKLILGGVLIPSERGLLGHSDADVLLHAITDAILGACSMGDIGSHFPDTDPLFKEVDSGLLLKQVLEKAQDNQFTLINIDSTLVCQSPKLAPFMKAMHENLCALCNLQADSVNIKAKTNEKLGYLGRGQAIEAQAIVLMLKRPK
jgi:2-C-methyl-D-erythritol 2,4-cyclodiphosphate synthase